MTVFDCVGVSVTDCCVFLSFTDPVLDRAAPALAPQNQPQRVRAVAPQSLAHRGHQRLHSRAFIRLQVKRHARFSPGHASIQSANILQLAADTVLVIYVLRLIYSVC